MRERGLVTGPHSAAKRQAAQQMRRSMTPAESRLWLRLKSNRLAGLHFRRQQVLGGFIVDFYCHPARLVVEVDGEVHAGQEPYDAERDQLLQQWGLRVLRFSNERVLGDISGVVNEIVAAAEGPTPALADERHPSPDGEGR
jgi:very-short-patch-repair endonuclease